MMEPSQDGPSESSDEPFDNIIDDETPRQAMLDYAHSELCQGRQPEAVVQDLVGAGCSADLAEELVEIARRQTRAARGVITQQDVRQAAEGRYRSTWAGMWLMVVGWPGILFRLIQLMVAYRSTPMPKPKPPVIPMPALPMEENGGQTEETSRQQRDA